MSERETVIKKPPRQGKANAYNIPWTVYSGQRHLEKHTPEYLVEVFGEDITEVVAINLCEFYLQLLDINYRISKLEWIIPTLPVVENQISLRGFYEVLLPHVKRERTAYKKNIRFLGQCFDLLQGTAIFAPKQFPGQIDVVALKQRATIADVVSQDVELRPSGRTFKGRCPFHKDRTPSFVVYPEDERWWCFGACNDGGDVISFVMKIRNCSFREALAELQTV